MKRTLPALRALKIVAPAAILLILLVSAAVGAVVYKLTHPKPAPLDISPVDYQELAGQELLWSDEQWKSIDGLDVHGWFLRGKPSAPAIVLSHGEGQTRSDLLRLGVRLWSAGYNVVLYDLRGHGQSAVNWSSLGKYEADDLVRGLQRLKELRDANQKPFFDTTRIGLYGVGVGGYASIVAAAQTENVRAVVVDSVYSDIPRFVHGQLKEAFGLNNRTSDFLIDLGLNLYLGSAGNQITAAEAIRSFQHIPLLMLTSNNAGELRLSTGDLFLQAQQPKEIRDLPRSRLTRLYGPEAQEYDKVVIDFFRRPDVFPLK